MIWDLERYGDRTALVEGDRSVSYAELKAIGDSLVNRMRRRSLAFILCRNTTELVAGYVAFLNFGVVPLMLEGKLPGPVLQGMIEAYHPAYIYLPKERAEEPAGYKALCTMERYALLEAEQQESCEMDEELALLISTSGSTGSSKLVRLSYKNIEANTRSIIEYLGITKEERAITSLPMNYVYGLSVLNTHLYAGASLLMTEDNCYVKNFWKIFEEKHATSFAGIPFMYETLHRLGFEKKTVPGLKTMTQAGGKLSPEMQDLFAKYARENGIRFFVMYGASEATARMGYLPPEQSLEKRGSMGIAIPGGRFEVIDTEGKRIETPHESGELVYYGDNVSLGYANGPRDLAAGDERKGRLMTGDIACFDEDGYYYIVGRKSRFIKLMGKKLNLAELEELLKKQFETLDIACAGKDDALEVYMTDASLKDGIGEYLFEEMKMNRHLFRLYVIAAIPKNSSGKTLYAELKPEEA